MVRRGLGRELQLRSLVLALVEPATFNRCSHACFVDGSREKWAQNCFYMDTYAVLAQTLISNAIPLVLNGSVKRGKAEGDMEYSIENKALGRILSFGRYIIMICIYVGFSYVIYSIFTIEHSKGAEYAPPISVTMQCVINLTFQFFFIYLMIWVCISVDEFTGHNC